MPLWAQLLDDLKARLAGGELTERFPTDLELTQEYGVSRHTAREAVRRLQQDGVVSRERGRGTFLTSPTIEQPTGAIYSLFRSIEAMGLEQRSDVLDLSVTIDDGIGGRLGLRRGTELVRLERRRWAGAHVLAHDTAWLPAKIARPLLDVDFVHTALYDELATRCGVRPNSGAEWIGTDLPDKAERDVLRIGARQPVFRIRRLSCADERPVEWRHTIVRGDRYTVVARWSPTGPYQPVLSADQAMP